MNKLVSLSKVFSDRIFRIPDYQRGYAWEKTQLEDFWEDIVNLPKNTNHYTGMLSLEAVPEEIYKDWHEENWLLTNRNYISYYVVDGQQRITTFIILIKVFIDFVLSLPENDGKDKRDIIIGNDSIENLIEKYLYITNKKQTTLCAFKFGYSDELSNNFFKQELMGVETAGCSEDTFYTHNLRRAKQFFSDNIQVFYKQYGFEQLEEFFEKATQKMQFIIHDISKDFDVYAAFETMNNRGKKLSNLELLKSRLIYLTTLYEDITTDERIVLRKNINDSWKEIYKWLGRNADTPLSDNDFLRAHWIIKYPFSGKRGHDYASFLLNKKFTVKNVVNHHAISLPDEYNIVNDDTSEEDIEIESNIPEEQKEIEHITHKEITNYVISLSQMAKHWFYSYYPNTSDCPYAQEEKERLDRLNRIGIAYFRPLVVASFMKDDISTNKRVALLDEIERFIFIAFRICGAYANYHQNEVNRKVRELYCGNIDVDNVIACIHNRIEGWTNGENSFNIKPFASRIQRLYSDGDGYYNWGPIRYLLYEYENYLMKNNQGIGGQVVAWSVTKTHDKDISIEHIYPQKPKGNSQWNIIFKKYNDEERKLLRGSLGNLLLLSIAKNASLQNDDYNIKKRKYAIGSYSETDLAANYKTWDADAILKRGLNILSFMERRWHIKFNNVDDKKEVLGLSFM